MGVGAVSVITMSSTEKRAPAAVTLPLITTSTCAVPGGAVMLDTARGTYPAVGPARAARFEASDEPSVFTSSMRAVTEEIVAAGMRTASDIVYWLPGAAGVSQYCVRTVTVPAAVDCTWPEAAPLATGCDASIVSVPPVAAAQPTAPPSKSPLSRPAADAEGRRSASAAASVASNSGARARRI